MKGIFVGRDLGSAQGGRSATRPAWATRYVNNEPVTDTLARTLPVTLSIVGPGGGALAGDRRRARHGLRAAPGHRLRPAGRSASSLTGASMPALLRRRVLLLVFVYSWAAARARGTRRSLENPLDWAGGAGAGLVRRWRFLFSAIYARLSRAQMLETLSEDFVRTARAKGLAKGHGVRPARAARGDHADRHHRRPGRRRCAGRHGDHRDHLRLQGLGRTAVDAVAQPATCRRSWPPC